MTWQTGFPFAVDYSRGYPRYRAGDRGLTQLGRGAFTADLLAGSPMLDGGSGGAFSQVRTTVVGPRASAARFKASVAIDTGVAGIHDPGTAYRMDEVPLPLRPPLAGPRPAIGVLLALRDAIRSDLGARSR